LKAKNIEKRAWRSGDILVYLLLAVAGVFPGQVLVTWGTPISLAKCGAVLEGSAIRELRTDLLNDVEVLR